MPRNDDVKQDHPAPSAPGQMHKPAHAIPALDSHPAAPASVGGHPPGPGRDEHLAEHLISSETLFDGDFLQARRDQVRLPDGSVGIREYVVHPGAVVVVALTDDDAVVVVRQYRYPVAQVMLEFPAGKLDAGESPLACGQRELQEETGLRASEWAYAGALHLAIGYSTEIIHIYFARGLTQGLQNLDEGEILDVHTLRVSEVMAACRNGGITDAKTLTCALWLQNVQSETWSLDWVPTRDV